MGVYYTLLCFILWLVLAHPKYSGPSKIHKLKNLYDLKELAGVEVDVIARNAKIVKTETKK